MIELPEVLRATAKDLRGMGNHMIAARLVEAADEIDRLRVDILNMQMKQTTTLSLKKS